MKKTAITITLLLAALFSARAQSRIDTLYVSHLYTTTLVFDTDITFANISNLNIISADIAKSLKNLFIMKAKDPFTTQASLTVVESNGRIHTHIICYKEHPEQITINLKAPVRQAPKVEQVLSKGKGDKKAAVATVAGGAVAVAAVSEADQETVEASEEFNAMSMSSDQYVSTMRKADAPKIEEVVALERNYYHLATKNQRITVACENLFAYSDITYLVISLKNDSGVSYEASDANFVIASHNKGKRKIENKINILPKNRYGNLSAAPGETGKIAYSFDKLTLSADQVLEIQIYEQGGQRNLTLTLAPQDVNYSSRAKLKFRKSLAKLEELNKEGCL